jgi:opacity protein-like surface antigen
MLWKLSASRGRWWRRNDPTWPRGAESTLEPRRPREFWHNSARFAPETIVARQADFLRLAPLFTDAVRHANTRHSQRIFTMRLRLILLAAAVLVFVGSPARAQDPDNRVNWQIGGGYTAALSDVRDYLGDGYNFGIGLTVNANRVIGFEGLYSFNGLGEKDFSLDVSAQPGGGGTPTPFTASMNMQYGTASVIFNSPSDSKVRPYGLTGVGVYYRPVTVTTPAVGFVPGFCSPWWYYCVPGGFVPVDQVVGDRSSTDFGMVFGGGINFRVSDAASVFFEARYHYIWGPEINPGGDSTLTGTTTTKANGQFLPITFGIRF